jgi:ABC-type nitrate/sulfonate/bicarbonate transport system substrate-binding protein
MQKGYAVNYIEPISYGIDFYGDVLFCTQQMAANNPELVKKFREASFKGWGYAMSHIDEMVQYILTLPGVQERGITKEILTYEANAMKN